MGSVAGMRHLIFLGLVAIGAVLYRCSLIELAALSSSSELHQHIPLIPLISAYFLFIDRRNICSVVRYSSAYGALMMGLGFLVFAMQEPLARGLSPEDFLSAMLTGAVVWAIGAFLFTYGPRVFKAGLFPMLFLAFAIPLPSFILDPAVSFLQAGSAAVADLVFRISGVPFFREGIIFSLPGIEVEVAKECSGIRSSLALIITAVVAGKLSLQGYWSKSALVAAILPITILKNALRIFTLSILASYVNPVFITGHWLHRSGGIPFFVAGLILLSPVLWILRRLEKRNVAGSSGVSEKRACAAERVFRNRGTTDGINS